MARCVSYAPPESLTRELPRRFPPVTATGNRLAYAQAMEDLDIYRVDPPGAAQPIARSSVQDSMPHLSPDGRCIAYCSPRSNERFEVWIADLDGSPPEQLTHGPGEWQCSPSCGSPRPVISCVTASHFSLGPGGIYYMPCAHTDEISRDGPVRVFNPASGEDRLLATLKDVEWPATGRQDGFLLVSPNGRTLLYSRLENREADLMLIEDFR